MNPITELATLKTKKKQTCPEIFLNLFWKVSYMGNIFIIIKQIDLRGIAAYC